MYQRMPRISTDKLEGIKLFDFKETLEYLLSMYQARIISINSYEVNIIAFGPLPESVSKLASFTKMSIPVALEIIENTPVEYNSPVEYEYTFPIEHVDSIRGLLYLATEKQRYEAFSKSIDDEITEQLGTLEE